MPTPKAPRIAIIGAGPSGCILARLLLLSGRLPEANISIFERETSLSTRDQGGTLDLHDATGLAALKEARLYEQFVSIARFDGDAMAVRDKHMTPYLTLPSSRNPGWLAPLALGKPEVDRLQLRKLLLDALPKGIVHWGRTLQKVGHDSSTLHFADGTTETGFDLIVGADGAYSVVRRGLTPQEPFYSGVGGFNLLIPEAAAKRPLLHKLVNGGSLFAFSDGKVVMGQQLGDGSIYVSMWAVRSECWMRDASYSVKDAESVKSALLTELRDWAPEVRELIAASDGRSVWPRSLVMLPVGMTWETQPGLTILGDAAHVMTPFVGEGVNGAMKDAMELAEAVIKTLDGDWTKQTLFNGVKNYEKGMFKRIHKVQKMTEDMMKLMLFTDGSPRTIMDKWIARSMSDELNPLALFILKIVLSIYFFLFKIVY
jgi:2-polyprenyl-6-methoxyphenol hydroxylase-like FAD-dependent oxidoreductase